MESLKTCLYQRCYLSAFPLFMCATVSFEGSFGGQWTRRCVLMPPVQQVLEGLETQTMKQLQMNYGVRSDLHESRCTDGYTEIHLSSIFYHFGLIPGGGGGAYSSCSHTGRFRVTDSTVPPMQVFGVRENPTRPQGGHPNTQNSPRPPSPCCRE